MTYLSETLFILLTLLLVVVIVALFVTLWVITKRTTKVGGENSQKSKEGMQTIELFTREIRSLKEQLAIQERLATLGEVSAGIAHELRNPLTVIAGNTRLLLKETKEPEQSELLQGILKEIEEINRIIEELLKFTHDSKIEHKEIDLCNLIRTVQASFAENDRIVFDQTEDFRLWGDEQLLKQAIKNLIKNGLEAGGTVWVSITPFEKDGRQWLDIKVTDNGKGLSEEELKKIFQPFYSTKQDGLGMGLPLVQKIALQHGGTLKVKTELAKGSEFTLSLPLKSDG